ncbi:nucleoside 2-deoxyribosyltransferase [Aeromonas veronii]|uniref:nucleoside 2-deoxyribosyltransferase n=1 Tax=Aeromonas TaxID=642 RepID=UPI001C223AEF|nr:MULTISPECIES: nucleoside 2-deoxyribosyltransferase [Aeromonas]MDO2437487.1 nucleoside 2-deoxyribosyltransferase [Aeromonas veronii]QWZ87260.1 nucleoside 2-deoxyribosyltransferase [Aeromonas sp. FDAARGOS 1404]
MNQIRKKIYLAGGFRSGWQETAKSKLDGFELLDPGAHCIKDPLEYTHWDLAAIRDSNIVLANMEASNPGGYALALEVGFAKALGKSIYLVDQIEDPSISHYFEMVRQCSDRVFKTLEEAILHIKTIESR